MFQPSLHQTLLGCDTSARFMWMTLSMRHRSRYKTWGSICTDIGKHRMALVCPDKDYRENKLGRALCTDIIKFSFRSWVLDIVNYIPKQLLTALGCANTENIIVLHAVLICPLVIGNPKSMRIPSKNFGRHTRNT